MATAVCKLVLQHMMGNEKENITKFTITDHYPVVEEELETLEICLTGIRERWLAVEGKNAFRLKLHPG